MIRKQKIRGKACAFDLGALGVFGLALISLGFGVTALSSMSGVANAQSTSDILRNNLQRAPQSSQQGNQQTGAQNDGSSALPQAANRRAPGMTLPTQQVNPFQIEEAPIPQSQADIERDIRDRAFNAAVTGLLPMQPPEIRQLLETYDQTKQAVEIPIYPYPEPEISVETVSLDPGTRPPTINLGKSHVTTVTIMDISGAPWPIQDLTYAGNFEVVTPEPGAHVIRITPMSDFAYGNVSVRLVELNTPITFILKAQRDKIHYRFDARIPEYGPYAEMPIIQGGISISAADGDIAMILDGIVPPDAQKLDVVGVDGRTTAYEFADMTYVRTPLTLLSPGWTSSVSSADGMNVYAMARAPVILLSDNGQVVRARLLGSEMSDE